MATAGNGKKPINMQQFLAKITQDQGPEFDQGIVGGFVNMGNVTTANPFKTDRKIKQFMIKVRGRLTNGAGGAAYRAGPAILGTPLFSLLQQVTIFGQHNTFGAQVPIIVNGEDMAMMMAMVNGRGYTPAFWNSVNGGPLILGQALSGAPNATNDFEFVLPIPTHPLGVAETDQVLYSLHGPDWAGNLNMTIQFADPTALGVPLANSVLGQFGAGGGNAQVNIYTVRPLLGKDLMARIKPAITFRILDRQQLTQVISAGAVGANQLLRTLQLGKDVNRVYMRTGTVLAATTAGITVFGVDSDQIITQTFPSLDSRNLRFGGANSDLCLKEYLGQSYGVNVPLGWKVMDFINGTGVGAPNMKASFPSSNLTAARQWQLNGDVALVAGNQIGIVYQEFTLGQPDLQ